MPAEIDAGSELAESAVAVGGRKGVAVGIDMQIGIVVYPEIPEGVIG